MKFKDNFQSTLLIRLKLKLHPHPRCLKQAWVSSTFPSVEILCAGMMSCCPASPPPTVDFVQPLSFTKGERLKSHPPGNDVLICWWVSAADIDRHT